MKFPIKVDIASSAQKRSILFQDELGGAEFPVDERFAKHRRQIQMDKAILFSHVHRLIRCIIDCQIHLQDAVAVRHALELARSLGARIWDSSPLQMKQIPAIGPVAVRKLVTARINSLEVLEATEPHKINMVLSKQPGFGEKILKILRDFPKLRVSIKLMGRVRQPALSNLHADCFRKISSEDSHLESGSRPSLDSSMKKHQCISTKSRYSCAFLRRGQMVISLTFAVLGKYYIAFFCEQCLRLHT